MADGSDVTGLVRRVIEANGRLYRGWMELSLDYLRNVTEILDPEAEPSEGPSEGQSEPETERGAIVLEAVGGGEASGAFLLTNDLGRALTCQPVASSFMDPDGESTRQRMTFEPKSVRLEPGEQRVVHASLTMAKRLPAGVAHTGAISIKGMDGFSVPVVLRRREDVEGSPIDRVATEDTRTAKKRATKKAASKKATSKKKTTPST